MDGDTISYTSVLTQGQVNQAAELIDSERPLKTQPPRRQRLLIAPLRVAAISDSQVVGIAAIKAVEGAAGEAGFLTVRSDFRRRGIASTLIRLRIEHAKAMGLHLLCANARTTNAASKTLLLRSGYEYYGDFLSSFGSGIAISWYFLVLKQGCSPHDLMRAMIGTPNTPGGLSG